MNMTSRNKIISLLAGASALAMLGVTTVSSQVVIGTQDFSVTVEEGADVCDDPSAEVGDTCSDGAIYAGLHDGERLFIAPANEGAHRWKTTATFTPGTYGDDGFMNFEAIRQVGLAAHPAANACAARGEGWFLPSVSEWEAIRTNLISATVNLSSVFAHTSLHWTSESFGTGKAGLPVADNVSTNYAFRPSDGSVFQRSRTSTNSSAIAHCVRHDGARVYEDPCSSGIPSVGALCQNGSLYAGGGLFVAPETVSAVRWKTSRTGTAGTQSETDGFANTNAMEAAGLASHPVANACRQLGENWYLPARSELQDLFSGLAGAPKALRHAFLSDLVSFHWTSTESSSNAGTAWLQAPTGDTAVVGKDATTAYKVRCMFNPGDSFVPDDLTPDDFLLSAAGGLGATEPDILITLDPVTITGISKPVPVSVTGQGSPEFNINGGGWVTSGTLSEGDVVTLRVSSADTLNTSHAGTLSVGDLDVSYSITTRQPTDSAPDALAFASLTDQMANLLVTSTTVTPIGYEQAILVPGSGLLVSVEGGAFSSDAQTINDGETITLRATTPDWSTSEVFTLEFRDPSDTTVYTANWSVSSRDPVGPSNTAMPWSYGDWSNTSPTVTSAEITLAGVFTDARVLTPTNPPSGTFTVGECEPSIIINGVVRDRCALNSGNITVNPGDEIRMRTRLANFTQNIEYTFSIGERIIRWCVTDSETNVGTFPDPRPSDGLSVPGCPQP